MSAAPVKLRQNAYRGVNAHAHSVMQRQGDDGWQGFHTNLITRLAEAIDRVLPAGYLLDLERSLQIREVHPDTGEVVRIRRRSPDITLFSASASQAAAGALAAPQGVGVITLPMIDTTIFDEAAYYRAILIYETQEDRLHGRPIIRIEILSPSNKVGETGIHYQEKRMAALASGLRMVEIDLLHETPSPILTLPSYPQREEGASPYIIAIDDPTPTFDEGQVIVYQVAVDESLPTLTLPLLEADTVIVDLDAVYQATFHSLRVYSHRVDYAQPPERFDSYSETDQARILAVMARAQALAGQVSIHDAGE